MPPPLRTALLGNSGSGKSTLARRLAERDGRPVLDLDTLVWEPGTIGVMRDAHQVQGDLEKFCIQHESWIIEGCYAQWIQAVLKYRPELVFLDPGEEVCIQNCRSRPWEPHKYASKEEQDGKLEFLLGWVADYYHREGDMSWREHHAVFEGYEGMKRITQNA